MRSKPDRLITFVRKRRNRTHGMVPIRYPQILPLRPPALFRALVALRRPFEMDLHGGWHVCRLYYRRVRQDLIAPYVECSARLADHDRRAGFGRTDSLRQETAHGVDADIPAHVSPRHRPNHPDETRCHRQLAVPGTGPAVRRFERSGSPWGVITRARVTQIMGMLRLPSEIREKILSMPDIVRRPSISERMLRPIAAMGDSGDPLREFRKLPRGDLPSGVIFWALRKAGFPARPPPPFRRPDRPSGSCRCGGP